MILTVLFELHDRNSGITLAEFAKAIALDMLLAAEIIVNTFSKCTGTFSVYDTDGRKVGNVSIVKIFIQLHDRLVNGLSKQIDLCADRCRFGHFDLAGTGLAEIASGDHGIIQFFQIPDVYLRTQDSHLNKQVAFCIRQRADRTFEVQAQYLYAVADVQIFGGKLFMRFFRSRILRRKLFVNCGHFLTQFAAFLSMSLADTPAAFPYFWKLRIVVSA